MKIWASEDLKKYVRYLQSIEEQRKAREAEKKQLAKRIEKIDADLEEPNAKIRDFFLPSQPGAQVQAKV